MGWLDADRCLVIAHRGARLAAPENTLRAFRLALEQGADGVELDVRATRDGHLVVVHDAALLVRGATVVAPDAAGGPDASAGGRGGLRRAVAAMDLADLRRLDAGGGERIPTLAEALDLARGRLLVDIELKITGIEPQVIALVRERGMEREALISSFHEAAVAAARALAPEVAAGLLQEQPAPDRAAALGAPVYLPAVAGLSAAVVRACRARGLRVIPWTVRRDEEADAALRLGVDGIIADDPHLVRSALARAREEASR